MSPIVVTGSGFSIKVRLEQRRCVSPATSNACKVRRVNALQCKHARTRQTIGVRRHIYAVPV